MKRRNGSAELWLPFKRRSSMDVLLKFLKALDAEGIGFYTFVGSNLLPLDPDEVIRFLEDREAFESDYEVRERERMDQF
jgi:hypothetical protein